MVCFGPSGAMGGHAPHLEQVVSRFVALERKAKPSVDHCKFWRVRNVR